MEDPSEGRVQFTFSKGGNRSCRLIKVPFLDEVYGIRSSVSTPITRPISTMSFSHRHTQTDPSEIVPPRRQFHGAGTDGKDRLELYGDPDNKK